MIDIQKLSDKTAIGLSLICLVHCLALPILFILMPSIAGLLYLDEETFHQWLLFAVVPISVLALLIGYRNHRSMRTLLIGVVGLAILFFAAFFSHDLLGHDAELIFTVIGSSLIAVSHIRNYRLRNHKGPCPSQPS